MFWVTTALSLPARSSSANFKCAALGLAPWTIILSR